jgi:hypothetical protein
MTAAVCDIARQVGKLDYRLYRSLSLKMGDPRRIPGNYMSVRSLSSDPIRFQTMRLMGQSIRTTRRALMDAIRCHAAPERTAGPS